MEGLILAFVVRFLMMMEELDGAGSVEMMGFYWCW